MGPDDIGWYLAYMEIRNLNSPWRKVLCRANRRMWPKGHTGATGNALFFLDNGCIDMRQIDTGGNERILWYIRENCIFGEAPFFCKAFSTSHYTCAENSVIYSFDEQTTLASLKEHPDLNLNLTYSMAHKMRILAHQTASLILDSLLVRLCKFIAQHLVPESVPLTAEIQIPRQDLANIIGANRISLYKIMKDKEEEGLWTPLRNGRMAILKPEIFFRIVAS